MDNSVYIPLSRQLALFRDMAVTSNNLANVNTTGFNSQHVMFTSYLNQDNGRGKMAFAHDISTYRNTENGSLNSTGNPLDVAISGEGYFVLDTPLGPRYSRGGSFQIDPNGVLVNLDGYPVMDANGQQIIFTNEDRDIMIGEAGNLSVNGEERALLGVVTFENPQELRAVGSRLYTTDATPQPASARVVQGALENSNVQPVTEMTHMIEVSRAAGNTSKFIEVMYELQRKTTTTWTQQG